jgi:hypothetical protein
MLSGDTASAAAAIATGLATLTIYGVVEIKKEYAEHKQKKQRDEMKAINSMHDKTLTGLEVKGRVTNTVVTTPAIFLFEDEEKKSNTVAKSLYINASVFEDLYNDIPTCNDSQLLLYCHYIQSAMVQLREFHHARIQDRNKLYAGSESDLTSSVIYYIILMLSTHCYKFEGNALTMAYLRGLMRFIDAFASEHGQASNRFEYLSLVSAHLANAHRELFQNSLMFSYKECLDELSPQIMGISFKLLKCAVQLTTPKDDWKQMPFLISDKLAKGLIKEGIKKSHAITPGAGQQTEIPESIFKTWIMNCATDFLLAIKINDNPEDKADFIVRDRFELKDNYSHEEMNQLRVIFLKCSNFLTKKIQPTKFESTNTWASTNDVLIAERIVFYNDLIRMIEALNVLIYFCAHLSNRIKQLGEIYISNPHHCVYIFEVMRGMGEGIKRDSKALLAKLENFSVQNGSAMVMFEESEVLTDLERFLQKINRDIANSITYLYNKHQEHPKLDKNTKTTLKPNLGIMLTITQKVADVYRITTSIKVTEDSPTPRELYDDSEPSPDSKPHAIEEKKPYVALPISLVPTPVVVPTSVVPPSVVPIILPPVVPLSSSKSVPAAAAAPPPEKMDTRTRLMTVATLILGIQRSEPTPTRVTAYYQKAYAALDKLYQHSENMLQERGTIRAIKGEKCQQLVNDLSVKLLDFLKKPAEYRRANDLAFLQSTERLIARTELDFLDWPKIPCSTMLFKTTSRKKLLEFEEALTEVVYKK